MVCFGSQWHPFSMVSAHDLHSELHSYGPSWVRNQYIYSEQTFLERLIDFPVIIIKTSDIECKFLMQSGLLKICCFVKKVCFAWMKLLYSCFL